MNKYRKMLLNEHIYVKPLNLRVEFASASVNAYTSENYNRIMSASLQPIFPTFVTQQKKHRSHHFMSKCYNHICVHFLNNQ